VLDLGDGQAGLPADNGFDLYCDGVAGTGAALTGLRAAGDTVRIGIDRHGPIGFHEGLKLLARDRRHAQRRLALIGGQSGVTGGLGAGQLRGNATPRFQVRPGALCRRDRPQQLAAALDRSRLDAVAHAPQRVVLRLLGVARQRL
jgi:hypothetical protein